MKVLLVDDEKYIRDEFRYFLEKHEDIIICGETGRGDEVIPLVKKLKPDLIFLDINLQIDNGLIIARKILEQPNPPQIVLATAFDQHAVKGYEMGIFDYLVKPIMEDRLIKCINRARDNIERLSMRVKENKPEKINKIAVNKEDKIYLLKLDEIVYLEYINNKIAVMTKDDVFYLNQSLKSFIEDYSDKFIRTHKSFVVNIDYINEIIPWFNYTYKLKLIKFENTEIPVSRNYIKEFKEKFKL